MTPPLFIEVSLYQIRKCICVSVISILPLSMILIFDFGIIPTVWYFLFFILLCGFKQFRIYDMIFETIYHNANILCHVVITILWTRFLKVTQTLLHKWPSVDHSKFLKNVMWRFEKKILGIFTSVLFLKLYMSCDVLVFVITIWDISA